MKIRFLVLILVVAGFCGTAQAKSWAVDYAKSHLGFIGKQGDTVFKGSFKSFKADIDFDPDHPETGKISATVDTASASTGDGERDGMLPKSDWFDTAKFPQAQFASTKITKAGTDAYRVDGTLTIKGITKPVILIFRLTQEGDHWRVQGNTALVRTDFHIGEGQWSKDSTVKSGVNVRIDLAAKPNP